MKYFANGDRDRLPELMTDALRARPDIIVTPGSQEALAARRATTTVPIVGLMGDPVGTGLVASLSRPDAGGLISYGPDLTALWHRVADYVDKVLKGANPAELPIEQPVTFELVINLQAARAVGITIPESLLVRADRVLR